MDKFLSEYSDRMRPAFKGIGAVAGHQTAFAFLSFKMGLYDDAIQRCDNALLRAGGSPGILSRALRIVRERAQQLVKASYHTPLTESFTGDEVPMLAISPAETDVPEAPQLQVANAMILLYAAGLASSPDDVQALEEQEKYVLQLVRNLKKGRQ